MKRAIRIAALVIWAALFVSCDEGGGCTTAIVPWINLTNNTKVSVVFRVSGSDQYSTRIVGPAGDRVYALLDTPYTIGVQLEKSYTELMTNEEGKLRAQLKTLNLLGWKDMDELKKQMGNLHVQVQRIEKNEIAKCTVRLSTEAGVWGSAVASLDQNGRLKLECSVH